MFSYFSVLLTILQFVELEGLAKSTHVVTGVSRLLDFFTLKLAIGNETTCNLIWSDFSLSSVDCLVAVESTDFLGYPRAMLHVNRLPFPSIGVVWMILSIAVVRDQALDAKNASNFYCSRYSKPFLLLN